MWRRAVLWSSTLLVVAACSSAADNASRESDATEAVLDGSTFLALPADGIDPAVLISFADGQLTYRSTCNSLFGSFSIEDGVLDFAFEGATLVGCSEPDSMVVVGELLSSAPSLQLDQSGALRIVGEDRTLVVQDESAAEPVSALLGKWSVRSVFQGQGAEQMWALTSAAITIGPDQLLIEGPCTDGVATASLDMRRLTVSAIEYSPSTCDEQGTEIEAALVDVFSSPSGSGVTFDIITTRAGIRLEPAIDPQPGEFMPVGLSLVPFE